jgi:dipeptidyl aminopeptidase/acylaminoacyl peptidase
MFSYDHSALQATAERVEETSDWREEKVSFKAAYGGERVIAYLFLPKNAKPPYQTVVYFPGREALGFRSSRYIEISMIGFLMQSGRAVIYPIYKGTYERNIGIDFQCCGSMERDLLIQWGKDVGRSLDYLETRPDIDTGRLAYFGVSAGAVYGPIFTQVDHRFKASVLAAGGLSPLKPLPEVDAVHYLPRNHTPTLLIAGREDYVVPVETHQKPLMRLLAAAPKDKRHVILNSGHLPAPWADFVKEVVTWLDQRLGPVRSAANQ